MAIAQGKGGGALPGGGLSQGKGGPPAPGNALNTKLAAPSHPGRALAAAGPMPPVHAGGKPVAQLGGSDLASQFMGNRPTRAVVLPDVRQPTRPPLVMPPRQPPPTRPAPPKPTIPSVRPQAPARGNPRMNGPGQLAGNMEWAHDGLTEHGAPSTNGAWYARPTPQPQQPAQPAWQPPALSLAAEMARQINERAIRRRNGGRT